MSASHLFALAVVLGAGSLVAGVAGMVWRSWAVTLVGAALGLGFSFLGGFSIGYYTALWPIILGGQAAVLRRAIAIRFAIGGVSVVLWLILLAVHGIPIPHLGT